MGELFNTQHEYVPLIANRLIDFIRIHISQIGGLSMARKVAALVRVLRRARRPGTAPATSRRSATPPAWPWSWPATISASTRAASFPNRTREVFPGCPETKDGFLYANEAPGLGIDLDETLAAKFPLPRQPDLRSPLGHDPQSRRHGDPAVIVGSGSVVASSEVRGLPLTPGHDHRCQRPCCTAH